MKVSIFTWSIENISKSWHGMGDSIASPTFFSSSMQNTSWLIYLYPRGKMNSDYISIKLLRGDEDQGPETIAVNVELSCITADTTDVHNCFIPERLTNFTKDRYSNGFLEPCFMQRHEVFGQRKELYLPKDILTLRCRIWKDSGDVNEFDESFGRTELVIERMFLVKDIDIENSVEKTIDVTSERENKTLISISLMCCDDMINVGINSFKDQTIGFSTCKLSLENKWTERTIFDNEFCFFSKLNNVWRLPVSGWIWPTDIDDSDKIKCTFTAELVYSTRKTKRVIEKGCAQKISEFLSNYIGCTCCGDTKNCPNNCQRYFCEDLWKLVMEKYSCDMILNVQGQSFLVHKTVLCARSPVFSAMLTSAMKEVESGCIDIEDTSVDTMNKFLVFLYRDRTVISNWNDMMELYCVADKYNVERLKLLCCCYLMENISADNFCDLLMLADSHHDYELKSKVNNIIWENDQLFFRSYEWKKLNEDIPNLAIETWNSKYEERGKENYTENYEDKLSKHPTIQDDFRSLYEYRIASDIVIKTSNNSYKAYKTVLCASSLILRDRLLNEIDVIDINDLEDDIVSGMLFFLHTGSFENIQWSTAKKLYHAAVEYKIHRLQFKSSCYLIENLTVSNASEVLLLALEHRDVKLKGVVENYICVYDKEIFRSVEWVDFCKDHSYIAIEMMCAVYRRNM